MLKYFVQRFLLADSFMFQTDLKALFHCFFPLNVSCKPAEFRVFMRKSSPIGYKSHVDFAFFHIIHHLVLSHFPTSCFTIS